MLINFLDIAFIQKILSFKDKNPRILYYHLISNNVNNYNPLYYYRKESFKIRDLVEQIKWLKNKGYEIISLEEAFFSIKNNENRKKTLSITTDDGFRENYDIIAPVFIDMNITCTIFLITNCINNRELMWKNKIFYIRNSINKEKEINIIKLIESKYMIKRGINDLLKHSEYWPMSRKDEIANYAWTLADVIDLDEFLNNYKPYMSEKQIEELIDIGFGIGSHTKTHPDLTKLSIDEIENELYDSKNYLEKTFKKEILFFSYPFGKRLSRKFEKWILKTNIYKLLLGTKSNLNNNKENYIWERDNMEQEIEKSKYWFTYIPVIRSFILHPLKYYK